MEIKTSELSGPSLDWAVAKARGLDVDITPSPFDVSCWPVFQGTTRSYRPSTDWSQGGPLIDQYRLGFTWDIYDTTCLVNGIEEDGLGETYLIAACRAIVASKLGKTVSVPDELEG